MTMENGKLNIVKGERVVAVFDILGFKNIIQKTRPDDLLHIASIAQFLGDNCAVDSAIIESFVFSDTIVLYGCKGHHELEASMLVISCSDLLSTSTQSGFLLRGALTFGHLYIDHEKNAIVGAALVKGLELGQSQDWTGAIVDPDFNDLYLKAMKLVTESFHNNLVHYPAPLKFGNRISYQCIGWMHQAQLNEKNLKRLFGSAIGTHDVYRKYINSLEYLNFCKQNRLLGEGDGP